MTCLKGPIWQISRGKLTKNLSQISVNHPLTCHRCKCRRCGACHLECSSSAGTGCKETKVVIIDFCKTTPRQVEKQVLLEYSCVGVNPQLPNEALCLFLLSWTLQLPHMHSSAALQVISTEPLSNSAAEKRGSSAAQWSQMATAFLTAPHQKGNYCWQETSSDHRTNRMGTVKMLKLVKLAKLSKVDLRKILHCCISGTQSHPCSPFQSCCPQSMSCRFRKSEVQPALHRGRSLPDWSKLLKIISAEVLSFYHLTDTLCWKLN